MTQIKSFHSAPHSLVQSAVAVGLKGEASAKGIATAQERMRQVTSLLATFAHRRVSDPRTRLKSNPLGQTSPFSGECIAMMYDYAVAALADDSAQMAEIASDFEKSSCDAVGWLGAALDYITAQAEFWDKLVYFDAPSADAYVYPLPEQDTFKIGILGDWGTGESVAQLVVNAMMAAKPDVIIHVGDVYYAGTADEVASNYLGMIATARAATGCKAPVYNLPGNHDYYTKGQPFYDALTSVNQGATFAGSSSTSVSTQQASFFVLRNSWLQLQGMDTGYYDSDLFDVGNDTTRLHADEVAWHLYQLAEPQSAGRSVFLFSHHQAWSAFLEIGTGAGTAGGAEATATATAKTAPYNVNLQAQLASVPKDKVRAWFWGHEHVLEVYDAAAIATSTVPAVGDNPKGPLSTYFPWLTYGACIGFSAFPMLDTDEPYGHNAPTIQYNHTYTLPLTSSNGANVYAHGFTILDVARNGTQRPTATATYYWLPADGSSKTATAFPVSTIP